MRKHLPIACLSIFLGSISTGLYAQHVQVPLGRDAGAPPQPVHPASLPGQERSDPIWSDDFSGPAHWTFGTLDSTAHNWVIGTAVSGGAYPMPAISSTSAANGYALFDSGLPCGPDNGYMAIASPVDLSGHAHVQLLFEQFYRKFQGHTYVDVSNDGSTWTPFEVNVQLNVGQYTANPEVFRLDISSVAAMQDSVWFRFRYTGNCDYAWMVDDVALVEQPAHEISLVSASTTTWDFDTAESYDSVYYSNFPMSEIRPLAVNLTVFNAGYEPATNVVAHFTTSDGYDATSNLGTLAPGDTLTWFGPLWTPTASIGQHGVQFTVQADDADVDTTDNAVAMSIGINGDMTGDWSFLARDNGALATSVGDGANAFKVGNWVHLRFDHYCPPGILVAVSSTSDADFEINGQILDSNLLPIVETAYYTLNANDYSDLGEAFFIELPFYSPVELTGGSDYFVAVQHFGGPELWVGASGFSESQSSLLYRTMEDTWYSISPTPMVRLGTDDSKGCVVEEISKAGTLVPPQPNPADGATVLSYSLGQSQQVALELLDVNGKLLRTLAMGTRSAGRHKVQIDTHDLAAGIYSCVLRMPAGQLTRRLVVMH